jgi:hypothetical protein
LLGLKNLSVPMAAARSRAFALFFYFAPGVEGGDTGVTWILVPVAAFLGFRANCEKSGGDLVDVTAISLQGPHAEQVIGGAPVGRAIGF